MYAVRSASCESFYVRLLLFHVRGVTFFGSLETLNDGTICPTFQAVCRGRGFSHTIRRETAALTRLLLPDAHRCEVAASLWLGDDHKDRLVDDVLYQAR